MCSFSMRCLIRESMLCMRDVFSVRCLLGYRSVLFLLLPVKDCVGSVGAFQVHMVQAICLSLYSRSENLSVQFCFVFLV